jgi:transposase
MMSQEEFMDLVRFIDEGFTYAEIGRELGYHPATIAKWHRSGGPPPARVMPDEERVLDERWRSRIDALLAAKPRLLATSVFDILKSERFEGSYPTVARYIRDVRGPRFRAAPVVSVPIETAPGEEGQFDWSDCNDWAARWGWDQELHCFGAILCWSRLTLWWFTDSIDREHTFEGMVRFFEHVGGMPAAMRTDRMGALGRSQGKRFRLFAPSLEFARHHGIELATCQARDAKRKGKIERPFRPLKEAFLDELDILGPPADVEELNVRAQQWLARRVWAVTHRTTGEPPLERLAIEQPFLRSLPPARFDTAYVEPRRVHVALPLIEWRGVRYSVPPGCLGQRVEVRQNVDEHRIVVRWAGTIVATHRLGGRGVREVWDPEHRRAAEHGALARHARSHLRVVDAPQADEVAQNCSQRIPIALPACEFDVAVPDLARYPSIDTDDERSFA